MKCLYALAISAFLVSGISFAGMDKGYYPNARDVCQVHAQLKAGKRLPIDPQRAAIAKVELINKGRNLKVTAWDHDGSKQVECTCIVGPGDADLYPSVRLAEPPSCSTKAG
ncbi:hypothetical protein [Parachitinimonas caeni]|uniref:Uncharacterized protein n=1 Tax=Parachitinimonas caeni TaxID=3031301 RepID=A0ABT7E350_9NEIS|nr:hypothetical protein [Parachitinimonas caeni]MDK2126752.1 hypothetical protein [Parachitinimonas caeni]